jgi:membrane-bound serine protease (ClpP class)
MNIKFLIRIITSIIILVGITSAAISQTSDSAIYSIDLEDEIINPVSAEYITSAIAEAEENGAAALIISLDTPGGLLSSTRTIVKGIMNSNVPIVVYVAPKGSRAGSAGVFITLAANIAAMAPSTNIGAAHPVNLSEKRSSSEAIDEIVKKLVRGKERDEDKKEKKVLRTRPTPMNEKILNDTVAWAKTIARERGRNVRWATDAVVKSVSVTEVQAKELGVINFIAKDFDDLISKLDGRTVRVPKGTVTIETEGKEIIKIGKGIRLKILSILAHPNIAYILLMLGFYGLLFEFTSPGVGFPGIAGAICLILAFFGLQVIPTNYAGVALIALAIAMLIAELKVTSYGLLSLGGVATLLLGSLILFASPIEFMRASFPTIIAFTMATLFIAIFLAYATLRNKRKRATTGMEGLINMHADVMNWSSLHQGKVFVHGEIWNAHSDEDLVRGDKVLIKAVDGMSLVVSKNDSENKTL